MRASQATRGAAGKHAPPPAGREPRTAWRNWAGNQRADDVAVVAPRTVDELAQTVADLADAGRGVRPIGTGHSFTAIGVPHDVQLRLDHLDAITAVDLERRLVTVQAGIRLSRLNRVLETLGLGLTNLGDIEEQTLAGAVSTGTHGTGARFGGLATQVRALELVLADGSRLTCSADENPDVFAAARVGLGALGVLTSVTLQAEPAFAVRAREGGGRLDETIERFDHDAETHDHVEFYWFPHTRNVLTKHNTRLALDAERPAALSRRRAWWDDEFLSNTVFGAVVGAGRRVPPLVRPLARVSASALGDREFSDVSHRVFTSPRRVRFEEMEYAVPREHGMTVLRELVRRVEASRWRIAVPVEVRVAAADDITLSTATGRDTVYLAVHTAPGSPDRDAYFAALEGIAGEVGGRPHWGKLHGLDAATLRERYPRFDEFVALRDRLDPRRTFGNPHLERVLG